MTLFDQEYAVERYGDEREARGEARGEIKGATKPFDSMAELIKILLQQNRMDDIQKISVDKNYRDKLMKEFSLV